MVQPRTLKLAVTGTLAGLFSGLFGVGGGTVIVPLLVLWLGYDERKATGTSLAAIVVIATFATIAQGAYGNVEVLKGCWSACPRWAGSCSAPGCSSGSRPTRSGCYSRCC